MGDFHGQRAIPFSWENKPGVSKVFADRDNEGEGYNIVTIKLPPPPCPSNKPSMFKLHHGEPLHVPLPPCAFDQPPLKSLSERGFKIEDDPFLMAYKECTKSSRSQRKSSSSSPLKTILGYFSCKAAQERYRWQPGENPSASTFGQRYQLDIDKAYTSTPRFKSATISNMGTS